METAIFEGMKTDPGEVAWWSSYIPWMALGIFVVAIALSVMFLPFVLRGGMSRFAITKNLIDTDDGAAPSPMRSAATAASEPQTPTSTPSDTDKAHASSAPTWEGLDLSIFDED